MAAESTGLQFKIESEILTDLCNFVKLTFFFFTVCTRFQKITFSTLS